MFQKTAISRLAKATEALSSYETVLVDDLSQAMSRYAKHSNSQPPFQEISHAITGLIRRVERQLVSEGYIDESLTHRLTIKVPMNDLYHLFYGDRMDRILLHSLVESDQIPEMAADRFFMIAVLRTADPYIPNASLYKRHVFDSPALHQLTPGSDTEGDIL